MKFDRIGIIGAGSWGTSLAVHLSQYGSPVQLWAHSPPLVEKIKKERVNSDYLPGISIPENVHATGSLADLLDCSLNLFVTPSKALRQVASELAALGPDPDTVWVSCTKGIEHDSGKLMTQLISEELNSRHVAALSGPNFAVEIAKKNPSAAVIGCKDPTLLKNLQAVFSQGAFRVYTSDDLAGIQLGGALKNVIAIGAGCSDGLSMGDNAKAALLTRSLAEMKRLGCALGGKSETFFGLSGIGDLMATCFSRQSRNRDFGERIGRGESREEIQNSTRTVAEGVPTAFSAWQSARKAGVETPVVDEIYSVLYQGKSPVEAMRCLLGRTPKPEDC